MKIWETDTFWGRVNEKMDKKGVDVASLANACGMNPNTLYNQRSLKRVPRSKGFVVKMANFLGTTPEYLMTGENDQNGLTPEEERLLLLYSQLPVDKRELVFKLIKSLI